MKFLLIFFLLCAQLQAPTVKILGSYENRLTKEEIAARNRGINPRPEVNKVAPVKVPPKPEDKPARLNVKP